MRTICVVADDFGLERGIDEAIVRLAVLRRVQAIGVLVGCAHGPAPCAALRALDARQVDVGLHLDFTEQPLLRQSLRSLPGLIARAYAGMLDRASVRAEIRAQLSAFEAFLGRAPAFVDGHQHVHQLPRIRDELVAELTQRYGASRVWLRSTRCAPAGPWRTRAKPWVIERLGAAGLQALARREGFAHNGRLLGVYDFRGGAARYAALMQAWLGAARDGDLLLCHPGLGPAAGDALGDARAAEFAVLSSPAFEALLQTQRVTLRPISALL